MARQANQIAFLTAENTSLKSERHALREKIQALESKLSQQPSLEACYALINDNAALLTEMHKIKQEHDQLQHDASQSGILLTTLLVALSSPAFWAFRAAPPAVSGPPGFWAAPPPTHELFALPATSAPGGIRSHQGTAV